jgi:uncharacterized protein
MFVGVARLVVHVPSAQSLKDKRRVVLSIKERIRSRLHVSAAEVGGLDTHQRAVIGVAVVSNEAAVCDEQLANAAQIARGARDAVLLDVTTELISLADEGRGVGAGAGPFGGGDDAG